TSIKALSSSIRRWVVAGNKRTSDGRANAVSSSCRGVASNHPHAVDTVCGSRGSRNVGTTECGRRYAQNGRLLLRSIDCAIGNGGCRSARIADSAVGDFLSLALLGVLK